MYHPYSKRQSSRRWEESPAHPSNSYVLKAPQRDMLPDASEPQGKVSFVRFATPRPDPPSANSFRQVTEQFSPHHRKPSEVSVLTFYNSPEDVGHDNPHHDHHQAGKQRLPVEDIDVTEQSKLTRISESPWRDEEEASSIGLKPTPPVLSSSPSSPSSSPSEHQGRIMFRAFWKRLLRYRTLKLLQVLLAFYVGFLTYADIGPPGGLRDQETGLIIDQASEDRTDRGVILVNGAERAIVATTFFQVVCIGITRMSAFFMYPALVMVFFSKFRATTSFLARTPVALFLNGDMHELHVYCGWTILIFSTLHTVFHLARWAEQGNLYLVFHHITGITGFCIVTSMVLICLPMMIYKDKVKYEIRKNMHYFFIVFAICLAFHTSPTAIPNGGFTSWVFGTLLVWWVLDFMYCTFIMSEKIETTKFDVLPTGVQMTMAVSPEFQNHGGQGGYCYVNFPWVDKTQWHAFSLFENPTDPTERQIFIQKGGDWTNKVHEILQRDTVRPAWVQGPFPSPYDSAEEYDNQILVASGIGITPALSVIRAHRDTRRINLIWAVRDPNLLQFFLRHLYLDNQGWNLIFYTGKEPLEEAEIESFANTNVCIITGRPNLNTIIPNIIYGIESGKGLPENYVPDQKVEVSKHLATIIQRKRNQKVKDNFRNEHHHRHYNDDNDDDDGSVSTHQIITQAAAARGFGLDGMLNTSSSSNTTDTTTATKTISTSSNNSHHHDGGAPESSSSDDASSSSSYERQKEKLIEHLRLGFKPWEEQQQHEESSKIFVKNLDPKKILSTWGMLYCGGAQVVEKNLRQISEEYKLDLHIESFGW